MEANLQCPLDPFVMDQLEDKMNLARVLEIESHISSSSCIHPPLKDIVFHGTLDGSTPLLVACQEGHLESVKHLIENWGVDVRGAANYYHINNIKELEKVEGATALFVAAQQGHVDIVSYIISRDPDLSPIISTETNPRSMYAGMTPLQVAIQCRHPGEAFEDFFVKESVIVRLLLEAGANPSTSIGGPVWDLCSVYSIIELIKHGIDLDLRNWEGNTILHRWIEMASFDNLDIIDKEKFFVNGAHLLLERDFDFNASNKDGLTPILAASQLIGLHRGKTNCSCQPTLLSILDLLLEEAEIDATEKIDAMELAGAQLLLALEPEKAFHYWKKAMDLRQKEEIRKIPLQASGQVLEWQTQQQLEDVIQDKSIWWIQGMLAGLRILGKRGFGDVYGFLFHFPFTFKWSDVFHCQEKHPRVTEKKDHPKIETKPTVTQISDLCFETLEVLLRFHRRELELGILTTKIIEELIKKLPYLSMFDKSLPNVECESIKKSLKLIRELILASDPYGPLRYCYDCPTKPFYPSSKLNYSYRFYELLAGVSDVRLHPVIFKFLSESTRNSEKGHEYLLAEACEKKDWNTLRLLIHLQADPNATASENGPLHVVADQMMTGNDSQLSVNAKCEMIKTALQLISAANPEGLYLGYYWYHYNFYAMLADLPDVLLQKNIRIYLSQLVRRKQGALLAEACRKKDTNTLRLLLLLQADPNATDPDATVIVGRGNRPLHLVADQQEHPMVLNGELEREQVSLEMECTLAHLLYDYGADPYRKNYDGKTAVDIWTETNCGVEGIQSPKWKNRPYWCRNSIPKLACLATKTIHTNGIPHTRPGVLPVNLLHFVALH